MPVYEYQCTECDHSFEQRQGFDAEPVCSCPKCQNQARRRFVPAPIIFKGSGFYVTDYNGKAPSASKNDSGEDETTKEEKTQTATVEKEAPKASTLE